MSLSPQLLALERAGLIRPGTLAPDLEYLFSHALIQDAAYTSVLRQDRRRLHQLVGETLEALYADRAESRELAPLLARHFAEAGDDARALRYFSAAADAAARVYANAEALDHLNRALTLASRLNLRGPELIRLYEQRGRVLELTSDYTGALRHYDDMEAVALEQADRALELSAHIHRATLRSTPNPVYDPAAGQALSEKALALARDLNDQAAQSKVLWNLMLLNYLLGRSREAADYGERSLAIARELDLREQMAYTLNDLGRIYMSNGALPAAFSVNAEARELWQAQGNSPMLIDNLSVSHILHLLSGHYAESIAQSDEAFRVSDKIGSAWGQSSCRLALPHVYLERGEIGAALAVVQEAIRLGVPVGYPGAMILMPVDQGWIYAQLGQVERGLELARPAMERVPDFGFTRGWVCGLYARLLLRQGDVAGAQAALAEAYINYNPDTPFLFPVFPPLAEAELALHLADYAAVIRVTTSFVAQMRQRGKRPFVADALYLQARALAAQGGHPQAQAVLRVALADAEELGSRRMQWPVLALLADLEAAPPAAAALRQRARVIVQYVAEHIDQPDRRASFEHMPEVARLLSAGM